MGIVVMQATRAQGLSSGLLIISIANQRSSRSNRITTTSKMHVPAEYEKRIVRVPESGCWVWTGYLQKNGYGEYPRHRAAHRTLFEIVRGPVASHLDLDHLCRVRCCVNPHHLEPVTHKENVQRGEAGHYKKKLWADAATCKAGHPWTEESTYIRPDTGLRGCRICRSATSKKYQESKRA